MNASTARYQYGTYLADNPDWHASDAPWKADQVLSMLERNRLTPKCVLEIGCGSGMMMRCLAASPALAHARFYGYDISPQAVGLGQQMPPVERVTITLGDPLSEPAFELQPDLLLVMDVMEHVPDYLGFLQGCLHLAPAMVIHIPLDLHVSSLLRNAFVPTRYTIGHLH